MRRRPLFLLIAFALSLFLSSSSIGAEDALRLGGHDEDAACELESSICELAPIGEVKADASRFEEASRDRTIYRSITDDKLYITIFYTYDCPHCHDALTFLSALQDMHSDCEKCRAAFDVLTSGQREAPHIIVRAYEVKRNKDNIRLFRKYARAYGARLSGVPVIFIGDKFYIGYRMGHSCRLIAEEVARLSGVHEECIADTIDVPFIGEVDINSVSLFQFTVALGFLDGFNPCAMWVLMFLLGLLIHSRSRRRILLIGTVFVVASGAVYFSFMAAWFNLFLIIGLSSWITKFLAAVAIGMGLINMKDVFFFKRGVSLMIPESAKPSLYRKARTILHEEQTIFAIIGTILLAVFVNFIELACTAGLPAIFTKILTVRDVSLIHKYFYLMLYNIAYIVPLLIIVILFAVTLGRFKMTESHARVLKLLSGLLMLALGLVLLIKPELLILS